jgi:hypothetical protein
MTGYLGSIQNQFYDAYNWAEEIGIEVQHRCCDAYNWAEEVGTTVQQQVSNTVQQTKICVINFGHDCQNTANQISQACLDTVNKIEGFLYYHKETIFFIGCSLTTAYFAPHLFFPTVIVSVIARIELARNLKKVADYYLKDERNPYKLNPKYDICVNTVDVTLGTIAALDAVALGTIFMTNFWTVYLIPVLGGVVAGNCAAKLAMNMTNLLGSAPAEPEIEESESPKSPSSQSPQSPQSPFDFEEEI